MLDRSVFDEAKKFIYSDIDREIQLARASSSGLQSLGVNPGGANFLAALGLLCYTEWVGSLLLGGSESANFNHFFDRLGPEYKKLRQSNNIYKDLRCGMVHEYYVKQDCVITMLGTTCAGITYKEKCYEFCVESYFRDFKAAVAQAEKELFEAWGL